MEASEEGGGSIKGLLGCGMPIHADRASDEAVEKLEGESKPRNRSSASPHSKRSIIRNQKRRVVRAGWRGRQACLYNAK